MLIILNVLCDDDDGEMFVYDSVRNLQFCAEFKIECSDLVGWESLNYVEWDRLGIVFIIRINVTVMVGYNKFDLYY